MFSAVSTNYTYTGDFKEGKIHGQGELTYTTGGHYKGEFKNSCIDGYGIYTTNTFRYTGFFSINHYHGLGTIEDFTTGTISKGNWRNDKKHGAFKMTLLDSRESYYRFFDKDKLISDKKIQYINPKYLMTCKENPRVKVKAGPILIKVITDNVKNTLSDALCIVCMANKKNATNTACGHVALCFDCLNKCSRCPICRVENKDIIRLYVS